MAVYKAIWEYISLNHYSKPSAPAGEVVRGRLTAARRLLRPETYRAGRDRGRLSAAPPYLLNRAAPAPDLEQMVIALQGALHNWFFTRDPKRSIKVVVGPPGSNVDRTVAALGRRKGWPIVGPPTPAEILSGGDAWLDNIKGDALAPVVIPKLGSCYLRHHDGLALIGRLLDWLASTRRRCLMACDSWAWAYLVKALQIDAMLPTPLTLAPLDGNRLQFWLPTLARTNGGRFVFRDAGNGEAIFMVASDYADLIRRNATPGKMEAFGEGDGAGALVKQLAAYSRGLPKIAWTWWRECLQVTPEAKREIERTMDPADDCYTVWVKPWSQLPLPVAPHTAGTTESIILHTLLLHDGAPAELLELLLPLSHSQIRHALHQLREVNLVKLTADDHWRITLLGYPAVRGFMENEGYLVDAF
ncbi:MAG: hypothetical protein JSW55_13715 [Chloroflexota bacterium]|nr:MAG: hypothetical protein JSW55_13715 [Chloroflexota bacterium]